MRKSCIVLLTSLLATTAGAQQLVQTKLLDFKLESCFRADSNVDVGCNIVVTNNGDADVQADFIVSTYNSASTASYGGQAQAVKAKSAAFGGSTFTGSRTGLIVGHTSVRTQVNFDIPKGVKSLDTVNFSGIRFDNVPLANDLPDEPFVNAAGPVVDSFSGKVFKNVVLGCQREQGGELVTCYFTTQNTQEDTYSLSLTASDYNSQSTATTQAGQQVQAGKVALAGSDLNNSVTNDVPAGRTALGLVTFKLPKNQTFVPVVSVKGLGGLFRNVPISAQVKVPGALNTAGTPSLSFKQRTFAAVLDECKATATGADCSFTLTNRSDTDYATDVNINTYNRSANAFAADGQWYQVAMISSGGSQNRSSMNFNLNAGKSAKFVLSVPLPKGSRFIPAIEFDGFTFTDVPLK